MGGASNLPEMEATHRAKRRAAGISLAFNIVSTLVKVIAAVVTGSVGLLSEAIHSATDVFSSGIALASVNAAAAPPDEEHPFGHGKIESLAGFGESVMLFGIVAYVVFEAISRLFKPHVVESLDLGVIVMAASAVGALVVGLYARKIARQTESLALLSNSQHLMVDFVTSLGVLSGLLIVRATGWVWADSAVALIFAVWMSLGAWKLSYVAFHELIDVRLPPGEIERIKGLVASEPLILNCHKLRTRRSGNVRHIDMHIVVPREITLIEAHDAADRLEKLIELELAPANAVIHVDPYDPERAGHHTAPEH